MFKMGRVRRIMFIFGFVIVFASYLSFLYICHGAFFRSDNYVTTSNFNSIGEGRFEFFLVLFSLPFCFFYFFRSFILFLKCKVSEDV